MGVMDSGRWLRASGHLDRVLELTPQDRDVCLAALQEEDPESAADVAALLGGFGGAGEIDAGQDEHVGHAVEEEVARPNARAQAA